MTKGNSFFIHKWIRGPKKTNNLDTLNVYIFSGEANEIRRHFHNFIRTLGNQKTIALDHDEKDIRKGFREGWPYFRQGNIYFYICRKTKIRNAIEKSNF